MVEGGADVLSGYQAKRDECVRELLDVTDRTASFEWDLGEVKELHLRLSREMKAEVGVLLALDQETAA